MKKLTQLSAAVLFTFAGSVSAAVGSSTSANIVSFEAGTPAKASEVNANFSTLAVAVDELSSAVLGLYDRVEGLEGDVQGQTVQGRNYRIFGVELASYESSTQEIERRSFEVGSLQFNSVNQSGTVVLESGHRSRSSDGSTFAEETPTETSQFDYSITNGQISVYPMDHSGLSPFLVFNIVPGANMLVGYGFGKNSQPSEECASEPGTACEEFRTAMYFAVRVQEGVEP